MKFLLRHREFARLWLASGISQIGSQVSVVVVPLIAITLLNATTRQVAILGVFEFIPFLLIGLQAGAILDRRERKPIMLVCDIVRAIALAVIPIAWALGELRLWMLYFVVFIVGVGTLFFDVASQSITPDVVAMEQLGEAGQAMAASDAVARAAGPGIGGSLLSIVSAPVAILVDIASYVASFGLLLRVHPKTRDLEANAGPRPLLRNQIAEGVRFLRHHRTLRPILYCTAFTSVAGNIQQAVLVLFMVRTLHYSPQLIGAMYMVGNIGMIVGAAQSVRLSRWLRLGPSLWIMSFIGGVGGVLAALAGGRWSFPFLALGWLLVAFSSIVYNVGGLSLRQAATPTHLQGRVSATFRFFVWGLMPVGFLLGGELGTRLGLRETMFISGALTMIPFSFILYSPANDVATLADATRGLSMPTGALVGD